MNLLNWGLRRLKLNIQNINCTALTSILRNGHCNWRTLAKRAFLKMRMNDKSVAELIFAESLKTLISKKPSFNTIVHPQLILFLKRGGKTKIVLTINWGELGQYSESYARRCFCLSRYAHDLILNSFIALRNLFKAENHAKKEKNIARN